MLVNDWQELLTLKTGKIMTTPVVAMKCRDHGLIGNFAAETSLADVNSAAWDHILKEHPGI